MLIHYHKYQRSLEAVSGPNKNYSGYYRFVCSHVWKSQRFVAATYFDLDDMEKKVAALKQQIEYRERELAFLVSDLGKKCCLQNIRKEREELEEKSDLLPFLEERFDIAYGAFLKKLADCRRKGH
jgi:hypothetical protein